MASSSSSDVEDKRITVAIFGGGRIGTVHLRSLLALRSKYRVAYCVDINKQVAEQMAEQAGEGCIGTDDSSAVFAKTPSSPVQAIVVCSPTATHVPLIELAAEAGLHVFCEKPVSLSHSEVSRCFSLFREKGLHLYCAYQRRADASYKKLHHTVRSGSIGVVQLVKSTSRDHPKPTMNFLKISGGFFHDCGSHDIDLLCWVTGEFPHRVFAAGHAFDPEIAALGDFDTAVVLLEFPSGVRGLIDISRFAGYGYDQRLEVHGSLGMVQTENCTPTSCVISTKDGIAHEKPYNSFPQRYEQAYRTEIEHFYDVVRNGATPWISGDSCVAVAIIADAAEQSAKTNLPVELKF